MTPHSDMPSEEMDTPSDTPQRTGSVLDKYPERDLSHLTGETPPPPNQDDVPPPATAETPAASPAAVAADSSSPTDSDTPAEADDTTAAGNTTTTGADAKNTKASSSTWPLFALLAVVLLLVFIAFIWYVNPWPGLQDSITGLFSSGETVENLVTTAETEIGDDATLAEEAELRSWDYFIQVSSWPDLAKADLDAERFRAQGFDVIVESEFIPAKGGTYYRVRLGPYEDAAEAEDLLKENVSALPSGAFVDSTRLAEDEFVEEEIIEKFEPPQITPQRYTGPTPTADIVTEPMNGWAVKVSSFKSDDIARTEARKLLEQGYPSFITKKRIGSTYWYRVLVGPFSQKDDANRYMQLLNVTYGNEAYTVDLASY